MRALLPILMLVLPLRAAEPLEWVQPDLPAVVFSGRPQSVMFHVRNGSDSVHRQEVRARLFQLSSSTAMPVGDTFRWKTITLQPGQTVREKVDLKLPEVRTETRFLLRWMGDEDRLLGLTEFWASPASPLLPLKLITGPQGVGIYDPENDLKKELVRQGIAFTDLATVEKPASSPLTIIIPPSETNRISRDWLRQYIAHAKEEGTTAIVWLERPDNRRAPPVSQIEVTRHGKATVVLVRNVSPRDISLSPAMQLTLVQSAEIATRSQPREFAGLITP